MILASLLIRCFAFAVLADDNVNIVEDIVVDDSVALTDNIDDGRVLLVDRYGTEVVDAYETFAAYIYDEDLPLYYTI